MTCTITGLISCSIITLLVVTCSCIKERDRNFCKINWNQVKVHWYKSVWNEVILSLISLNYSTLTTFAICTCVIGFVGFFVVVVFVWTMFICHILDVTLMLHLFSTFIWKWNNSFKICPKGMTVSFNQLFLLCI